MTSLAGTGGLVRLILRRDRIVLPLWIVLLTAISVSYVKEYGDLFPTPAPDHQLQAARILRTGKA